MTSDNLRLLTLAVTVHDGGPDEWPLSGKSHVGHNGHSSEQNPGAIGPRIA